MNTVPYVPGQGLVRRLSFFETVPAAYAVPLQPPDQVLRLWLHFAEGFSLPCTGDDCDHCHLDKRPYGYTFVLSNPNEVVRGSAPSVQILGIPFLAFEFFDSDRRGRILEIGRKKNQKSGRLVIRDCGAIRGISVELPALDKSLQSLWAKRNAEIAPADSWEHHGSTE